MYLVLGGRHNRMLAGKATNAIYQQKELMLVETTSMKLVEIDVDELIL